MANLDLLVMGKMERMVRMAATAATAAAAIMVKAEMAVMEEMLINQVISMSNFKTMPLCGITAVQRTSIRTIKTR
jgi:hypothetical protein